MDKSIELYNDEYFEWWAKFMLVNFGETYSIESCDQILLECETNEERDRVIKIRDKIISKIQKSLN